MDNARPRHHAATQATDSWAKGSAGQEPQEGFGKRRPSPHRRPRCRSTVIPWLHPDTHIISCPSQHLPSLPCPLPSTFPGSTPSCRVLRRGSSTTMPAPTTAPLHPGDHGDALGTSTSQKQATPVVASPTLPDFARCHSLTPQPCPGGTQQGCSLATSLETGPQPTRGL